MKFFLPLFSIAFLVVTSCQSSDKPKEEDLLKAKADSIAKADSLLKVLNKEEEEKKKDNDNRVASAISIIKYNTSRPNSAGGVDANIVWKNNSEKTVKYAKFTVAPYNAVDDMVSSEVGDETYKIIRVTGPIKPGATYGDDSTWENIWYNSTIAYMKISGIELEYMDGSIISTENTETIKLVLPNKK